MNSKEKVLKMYLRKLRKAQNRMVICTEFCKKLVGKSLATQQRRLKSVTHKIELLQFKIDLLSA